MTDSERSVLLATQATLSPTIQADLEKLLLADELTVGKLKSALNDYYDTRPENERAEYKAALAKLRKLLLAETKELAEEVLELEKQF